MAANQMDRLVFDMDGDFFTELKLKPGPLLARGFSGEVMLATPLDNIKLQRVVKKFSLLVPDGGAKSKRAFLTEVSIMQRVSHPHINKFLVAGRCQQYLAMCMEFYTNGTLLSQLNNVRVNRDLVDLYLVQIACAIRYLHGRRIVHCDVKMENVFINSDKNAILGDFGLAVEIPADEKTIALRHCGGTPSYRAPETFGVPGDSEIDPFKLDAYSRGVLLWGLVFLVKPSILYNYLREVKWCATRLPRNIRNYLEALLEPSPSKRISVESLVEMLKELPGHGHLVDQL